MSAKKNRIYDFFKTTLLGGIVVILPLSILFLVFTWLLGLITGIAKPITDSLIQVESKYNLLVDLAILIFLVLVCFLIGLLVSTKFGNWIFSLLEMIFLSKLPGYGMVKETISHIFNHGEKSPFSSVVICQPYGNETLVTGFLTDKHESGYLTVFVPTGPNPTSGFIFHLPPHLVHILSASKEETMRSIISCGAGSKPILQKLLNEHKGKFEIEGKNSEAQK